MLFRNRIDLSLVSTKSRVNRIFRKIGPPLLSSSGNQSFRYIVRFTSTFSFECSCVRPISPVPYRFPVLQPFHAIAFAYFSFGVCSVEFVSWSRSCCWLGLVRVQFVCISPPFPSISSHRRKFFPLLDRFVLYIGDRSQNSHNFHIRTPISKFHISKLIRKNSDLSVPVNGMFENFKFSKFASEVCVFTS